MKNTSTGTARMRPGNNTDERAALIDEARRRLDRYDVASHSSDEDEWADLVWRLLELVKAQRTTIADAQVMLAKRTPGPSGGTDATEDKS